LRLPLAIVKTHRWIGLIVGLQVVLWISGGLVMSALSIDKVRGADRARTAPPLAVPVDAVLVSPTAAAAALGDSAIGGAALARRLDRVAWILETADGRTAVDAVTGDRLPDLTADEARAVAAADYAGTVDIRAVSLRTAPSLETRGRDLPLWRVDFADGRRTTVYVDPLTGAIAARRNTLWRVYDVFWMLHIMDYRERESFNHPLLVGSAAAAWLLAASGAWLVVNWLRRRARRS